MDRVRDTAVGIGRADDIYDMWKGFDSIKEFNKPLGYAFAVSGYTFLPSLVTSASRGVTKALGNKGIGWF